MEDYTEDEIEELRDKLIDYYGSASPIYPIAMADVSRIENASAEEIIDEAQKLKLI